MFKKILFLMVITGIVFFALFYFEKDKDKKVNASNKVRNTDEVAQKVLSFEIDGRSPKGARQWHLEGDSADIVEDHIELKKLHAVTYGDSNVINLTSDTGVYRKDKGEVELLGNVKVTSDDGVYLTTEKANWEQESKKIYTDQLVSIKKDNISAVGTGGMADPDHSKAMLKKNVTVKIEPATKVKCDGSLEIDYNNNTAVFSDNVGVEDQDGKLFSDKLIVEFDPATRKLSKVTAEGNVRVKKGNSYIVSEKAIYTDSTKSAKLLGRPRIIIDPAELEELDKFHVEPRKGL